MLSTKETRREQQTHESKKNCVFILFAQTESTGEHKLFSHTSFVCRAVEIQWTNV